MTRPRLAGEVGWCPVGDPETDTAKPSGERYERTDMPKSGCLPRGRLYVVDLGGGVLLDRLTELAGLATRSSNLSGAPACVCRAALQSVTDQVVCAPGCKVECLDQ
jgi:hypothetical protein